MIKGFKVGHFTQKEKGYGATVILTDEGCVGGVDVRGSAPGTRETDLLRGCKAVERINAVCLSGGSAFGLEACDGVMRFLSEKAKGFFTGTYYVPIVCGAVIYDLDYKSFGFTSREEGYSACQNACENPEWGNVGAGTGATVGKIFGMENCSKGGIGYSELTFGNLQIGAIVCTNAFGDVFDLYDNAKIIAGAKKDGKFVNTSKFILQNSVTSAEKGKNTTIGCLLTNAKITREQANKLASLSQNGLALAISPVHTMLDGDTMFALSSGEIECDFNILCNAAPEVVRQAVIKAVSYGRD